MWALAIMLLMLTGMLLPLRLRADVLHSVHTQVRLRLSCMGLRHEWRIQLIRTLQGHQLTMADSDKPPRPVSPASLQGSRGEKLMTTLLHDARARRYLLRHIALRELTAAMQLHAENAAHTALLTGYARTLMALVPPNQRERMRLMVAPDFAGAHSTFRIRCILQFRLGTIIITAGMLLAAIAAQRVHQAREAAGIWNIRSEN